MKKQFLSLAIAAVLAAGCSQTTTTPVATSTPASGPTAVATPAPAATATPAEEAVVIPDSWSKLQSTDGKMEMSAPPGWFVIGEQNPELKKVLDETLKQNPGMAQLANTGNYYFFGFDKETKNDFNDNVNVIKNDLPQGIPFDDATMQQLKEQFAQSMPLKGELQIEITKVPAGSAYRYTATTDMKQADGKPLSTYLVGYVLCPGTQMYVFTFSTKPESKEGFDEKADTMMKSVVLKP